MFCFNQDEYNIVGSTMDYSAAISFQSWNKFTIKVTELQSVRTVNLNESYIYL